MYIRDAVNYLQRKNVFIVRKLKEYGHSGDQLHVINIHATILVTMIYQARESGIIWQKSFAEIVNLLNAPGNNRYRNFLSYLVDLKLLEVMLSSHFILKKCIKNEINVFLFEFSFNFFA